MNLTGVIEESMSMILKGNNSVMQTLRAQYGDAHKTIERSEIGCYVTYSFSKIIPLLDQENFEIEDVYMKVSTLSSPIGFILYVRNGRIAVLELHTYGDDMLPEDFKDYSFFYANYSNDKRLPWYRDKSL